MLLFVDIEHPDAHGRDHGPRVLAARTTITYRLEDLSGRHCHLVRYDHVDHDLLELLRPEAVFLSGNSVDPADYDQEPVERFLEHLRSLDVPMFGFCGGFQWLSRAHGATVEPLDPDLDIDADDMLLDLRGRPFEFGYHPIDIDEPDHELLAGITATDAFRHAHGLQVPNPPTGFRPLGSTAATPVQIAVDDERRLVGTQFHPEYWTDEHPAGRRMIENFLDWSGVGRSG